MIDRRAPRGFFGDDRTVGNERTCAVKVEETPALPYDKDSIAGRLLAGEPIVVGRVIRWIAVVLATPRFWSIRDERDDLHQEIMTRVLQSLSRGLFDSSRQLQTYVQAVARNAALEAQRVRADRFSRTTVGDVLPARTRAPEDSVGLTALARSVLDSVPEDCRRLILQYFFREQSYEEIAGTNGWPIGTVKSRLARCLARAARRLRAARGAAQRRPTGREPRP